VVVIVISAVGDTVALTVAVIDAACGGPSAQQNTSVVENIPVA